jgi:CBS domain-containing protein
MTPNPACCTPTTTLDQIAKMMIQNDCGEIPVVDTKDCIIGVVTDRDIVCRVVAEGKNPMAYTAETCMSRPVVTVNEDASLDEVVVTMEKHQIRRVPVVDARGVCTASSRRLMSRGWAPSRRSPTWFEKCHATLHASHAD